MDHLTGLLFFAFMSIICAFMRKNLSIAFAHSAQKYFNELTSFSILFRHISKRCNSS